MTFYSYNKRALDIAASVLMLIFLSPLLLLISFLILIKIGLPIFFRQQRPGLNEKPFYLIKFRTMSNKTDDSGNLLPDAQRLSGFGKYIRSASLDELPTLYNVLKGDMSLVGPRPLLMQYLERYSPEQARRHEVKPGITGWAQVNGRNAITWEEKFKLDVWYVEHKSLWMDLKILLLTINKVLKREGTSASQHVTMPEFLGSSQKTHN